MSGTVQSAIRPEDWIRIDQVEVMTLQTWTKDVVPLWVLTVRAMSPEAARKAALWTKNISAAIAEFPPELRVQWMPLLADILGSVKDEHLPLLQRMWPWLSVAMLRIVAIFSGNGAYLRLPKPTELQYVVKLFKDLVTNGQFAPLVDRVADIGIRPASFPTVEEVKQQRVALSTQIFNKYHQLQELMQQHESFFIWAWKNKKEKLRTKVFEKAWVGMNPNHNMAFNDMLNGKRPTEQSGKWPHINVEDLCHKDSFLIFLKSRANVSPSAFYFLDKESWQIGVGARVIKVPYLVDCGMMFMGRETMESYGEILDCTTDNTALWRIRTGRALHVHHGLMTMEVQARIYKFLVDCCLEILRLDRATWNIAILAPDFQPPTLTQQPQASLEARVAEKIVLAPYTQPGQFDISRLLSLIEARKSLAEHELWQLRESPGHFAAQLAAYAQHKPEKLLICRKKAPERLSDLKHHPDLNTPDFWNVVVRGFLAKTLYMVVFFHDLHVGLVNLRALLDKYQAEITPDADLPKELEHAFANLWYGLLYFMSKSRAELRLLIRTCPKLQDKFFCPLGDEGVNLAGFPRFREKEGIDHPKNKDCAILLRYLTPDFDTPALRGDAAMPLIFDEFERYLESNPSKAKWLSPFAMQCISDVSLLADCWSRMSLFHPWAATFASTAAENNKEQIPPWLILESFGQQFADALQTERWDQLAKHFYGQKFSDIWPDDHKQGDNTTKRQASEQELDKVWQKVDSIIDPVVNQLSMSAQEPLRPPLPGTLERTPDRVAEAPAQVIGTKRARDWDGADPAPGPVTKRAKKKKTRGTPDPSRVVPEAGIPVQPDAQEPVKIRVNADDFKVFNALFYTPGVPAVTELPWQHFIQAMVR